MQIYEPRSLENRNPELIDINVDSDKRTPENRYTDQVIPITTTWFKYNDVSIIKKFLIPDKVVLRKYDLLYSPVLALRAFNLMNCSPQNYHRVYNQLSKNCHFNVQDPIIIRNSIKVARIMICADEGHVELEQLFRWLHGSVLAEKNFNRSFDMSEIRDFCSLKN
jgi:hypothetical protein